MKWTPAIFLWLSMTFAHAQNLTVQVGGKTVATRGIINFVSSAGIIQVCQDDASNNRITCMPAADSAIVATHSSVHSNENFCLSRNGTTAYTCLVSQGGLTSYATGMTFLLVVDTTCTGSCSLSINGFGVVSIKRIDGTTEPGGALVAGQPQWIFYDGTVFRLMGSGGGAGAGAETGDRSRDRDAIARRFIASMETMTYGPTISLEVTAGDLHKTVTSNVVGNATINAVTGGLPGQHMWIIIVNDLASGKTITFGTNLKSSGALNGTPGKAATIQFVSDGTAWYEVARTTNL